MLIKIHCDFELGDRFGMRPLMIAAYSGHLDLVQMLINNGADVTAVNKVRLSFFSILLSE